MKKSGPGFGMFWFIGLLFRCVGITPNPAVVSK